jgi:ABC-type multidrug transport system permease subunit
LIFLHSLVWLCIAVLIKTGAFVMLERRLPPNQAMSLMLAANVLSTIPGLLTAVFAGVLSILALPLVFALGKLAEKRLSALSPPGTTNRFAGHGLAFIFTAAFVVSVVMFYMAGRALDGGNFAVYWILKFLFATVAVSVGMAISTVLEECAIATLAHKGQLSFYTSVLRANYITLAVVLGAAAAHMLSLRFGAPHFIVSWVQSVASSFGLS